jgi:uncharacterized protein (TIGR02145 family)
VHYTPPPADAAVVGAHTYTRRAKDNACNTTLTPSTGSWVLTVICPFDAGAIATGEQTICSGNAVNTIPSSTDASSGDNNISYQWRRNGETISGATAATYSPIAFNATVGAHTFTRWVHNNSCQTSWMQSAGSWVLTVTAGTQLTLTTVNNNQIVVNGAAIAPIQYTTANASTVTCNGLPDGITGAWASNTLTISGNSTATGTHAYVITATGIAGCNNAYASGSIQIYPAGTDEYGCVSSNLTLGMVGFASTVTHVVSGTYGSQTWSAPVTATYCEKPTYNGGSSDAYQSDCSVSLGGASYGQWFSWCMVKQYADQLCPDPWRVPSTADFCVLSQNLLNISICRSFDSTSALVLIYQWGGAYGGATNSVIGGYMSGSGYYWASDDSYRPSGTTFEINSKGGYLTTFGKDGGLTLRCVRDE